MAALGACVISGTPLFLASAIDRAACQDRFRTEFAKQATGYWINRLEEADLLCAPVKNLADVLEDPQTDVNEMVIEFDHPLHGSMQTIACPIHFSALDCGLRMPPPRLGEHNEEILAELGREMPAQASGA